MYIWSSELVYFNRGRTWEQQGLTFVTRVYWTWTMCAQWAGKLMTAYICRLYTCSVKDVTLLLGTAERSWLKQKRTKHCSSTAATFKYDIFDSSTTSTHFHGALCLSVFFFFFFCSLCLLTARVCPCKDILAPVAVASRSFQIGSVRD